MCSPVTWILVTINPNLLYSRIRVCAWYDRSVLTAAGWIKELQAVKWQECHSEQPFCLLSSSLIFFKSYLFSVYFFSPNLVPVSYLYHVHTLFRPFPRWSCVFPQPNPFCVLICVHLFCPLPHHHYLLSSRNFPETLKQLSFSCFSLAGIAQSNSSTGLTSLVPCRPLGSCSSLAASVWHQVSFSLYRLHFGTVSLPLVWSLRSSVAQTVGATLV